MNKIFKYAVLFVIAAVVVGCQSSDRAAVSKAAPSEVAPSLVDLKLAAGDRVRVTVFGEDKISGDYDIDTAGYVSLPLAGSVKAVGLTKPDLERELARRLSGDYLKNPRVTVSVVTFRPFFILGEVEKPGEYQYRSGMNVLSAMAMAGGSTYRASKSSVLIQRAGTTELKEFPQDPTVLVMPGDLLRVPERYF